MKAMCPMLPLPTPHSTRIILKMIDLSHRMKILNFQRGKETKSGCAIASVRVYVDGDGDGECKLKSDWSKAIAAAATTTAAMLTHKNCLHKFK